MQWQLSMCNGSTNKTARVQSPTTYPRFIVHYLDAGYFFMLFVACCFFSKSSLSKIILGILLKCQTVWIQIRPDILSGMICFQTVCKGYQQTTIVDIKRCLRPVLLNEPWQDKTSKMGMHLTKTQISLGIRPDWSVFAVHSVGNLGPKLSSLRQWSLWHDWANV